MIKRSEFEDLKKQVNSQKINSGVGYKIKRSGAGTTLSVNAGSTVAAPDASFPFQIVNLGQNLGVVPESSVFRSLSGNTVTITGLLTRLSDGTISESDAGWFACPEVGQKVWLQIGTCNPDDTTHTLKLWAGTTKIQNGAVGGSLWDEYPSPIARAGTGSSSYQEFYNVLLAEVTSLSTDPRPSSLTVSISGDPNTRQITQMWSKNVMPITWIANGLIGYVPVDPTPDYPPSPL